MSNHVIPLSTTTQNEVEGVSWKACRSPRPAEARRVRGLGASRCSPGAAGGPKESSSCMVLPFFQFFSFLHLSFFRSLVGISARAFVRPLRVSFAFRFLAFRIFSQVLVSIAASLTEWTPGCQSLHALSVLTDQKDLAVSFVSLLPSSNYEF